MIVVLGNLLTLLVIGALYVMCELLASYSIVILYAVLLSEALWLPKQRLHKFLGGWISHTSVGVVLVLGLIVIGAMVLVPVFLSSCLDLITALGDAKSLAKASVSQASLQAWGIDEAMLQTGLEQVSDKLEAFELEYNSTPWWPLVENAVVWAHSLNTACQDGHPEACARFTANVSCAELLDSDPSGFSATSDCCACGGGVKDPWSDRRLSNFSLSMFMDPTELKEKAMLISNILTSSDDLRMHAQAALVQLSQVGGLFLRTMLSLTSSVATSIFFVSLTISLLASENNLLHDLVGGLFGDEVEGRIRHILGGVFFYPPALAGCRLVSTLLVAALLRLPYRGLLAMMTCLITFVPMLSLYPVIVALPWVVGLLVVEDYWSCGLLLLAQYGLLGMLESWLLLAAHPEWSGLTRTEQKSCSSVPTWATGLSIVLGFERFGVQAFVVGPLTASMILLMQESILDSLRDDDDDVALVTRQRALSKDASLRNMAAGFRSTLGSKFTRSRSMSG